MRDLAIHRLWQSVEARIGVRPEVLSAALADWTVIPLMSGGEVVGAFAIKDGEVHLGYHPLPKGSIRHHIKQIFEPALRRFGGLRTSVMESNPAGIKFCKRIGFIETGRRDGHVFLRCERLNYV